MASEFNLDLFSTKAITKAEFTRELSGSAMVNIMVGEGAEAKLFTIHKVLLCNKVDYFKRMFMGNFAEAQTDSAVLPEVKTAAFEVFFHWVYTDAVLALNEYSTSRAVEILLQLYAFAEERVITVLADKTMDTLIGIFADRDEKPKPSVMSLAYILTPEHSKLREFIARMCVYTLLKYEEDDEAIAWSSRNFHVAVKGNDDLLCEIFTLMRGTSGKVFRDPRLAPACDYHSHEKGNSCPYVTNKFLSPPASPNSKKRSLKKASSLVVKRRYSSR